MRLNTAQTRKVEKQLGVQAVEDANPAIAQLQQAFGDHTFFVDAAGLAIVETGSKEPSPTGAVVNLASWSADRTQLMVHEPEVRDETVDLVVEEA